MALVGVGRGPEPVVDMQGADRGRTRDPGGEVDQARGIAPARVHDHDGTALREEARPPHLFLDLAHPLSSWRWLATNTSVDSLNPFSVTSPIRLARGVLGTSSAGARREQLLEEAEAQPALVRRRPDLLQRVAALAHPDHHARLTDRGRRPLAVVLRDQPLPDPTAQGRGRDANSLRGIAQRHERLPARRRCATQVGDGVLVSARPRRPRASRPAASAVGARHVSGGASRSRHRRRPRSGLLPCVVV